MGEEIVGVLRQEGLTEAVVAGISVGGAIALQLSLDHPEGFKALQNRDVTHRLGELQMPVLVINGEFDNALSRSHEMAQNIHGESHHMIPGTGHACCLEDPVAFDKIAIEFIAKNNFMSPALP